MTADWAAEALRRMGLTQTDVDAVARRLAGEQHRHSPRCIHNLPSDEQIAVRGRTVEWWQRMGLPMPEQISPDDWDGSYDGR